MGGHSDVLERVSAERESVDSEPLEHDATLAVELAREECKGRTVGTIFAMGNAEAVRAASQPMILDPLAGHDDEARRLDRPEAREALKELALLDEAFLVTNEGVAVFATRYLDADASVLDIPGGLGSRHRAAAAITRVTDAPVPTRSDDQATALSRAE